MVVTTAGLKSNLNNSNSNNNNSIKAKQKHSNINQDVVLIDKNLKQLQFSSNDTKKQIKSRIRRCEKYCHKGKWKKGVETLDANSLVDLYKNNNFAKAAAKFPAEQLNKYLLQKIVVKLNSENTTNIINNSNHEACAGIDGIDDSMVYYFCQYDDKFQFVDKLNKLTKKVLTIGLNSLVSAIFRQSKCFCIGKEKFGIPDYDLRPIVIQSVIIRYMDRIVLYLISRSKIQELIRPYQVVQERNSLEGVNTIVDAMCEYQKHDQDQVLLTLDAENAFNSFSRNYAYQILHQQCPTLCNWFIFLYDTKFQVNLDFKLKVYFQTGAIQGLGTSGVIYNTVKWSTEKTTVEEMNKLTKGEFGITMKVDYHDDGITMINRKWLKSYLDLIIKNYSIPRININRKKSEVVLNTKEQSIKTFILSITEDPNNDTKIESNFDGNIYFCGVPHGTKEFVCSRMKKYCDRMQIRVNYIEHLQSEFVKYNICTKFYIYGKIMYIMRTVKHYSEWVSRIQKIHNYLENHALNGVLYTKTRSSQVPLSQGSGGLGLRLPSLFEPAAKISSLSGKGRWMTRFFPAHYNFNSKLRDFYYSNKFNNVNQALENINKKNNNNNISSSIGNNKNNSNMESDLIKQMVNQLANLDKQFKHSTILDDPIPKYLCEIAASYQHKMATNNIIELISQNLIFSKVMVKYRDRVGDSILRFSIKEKW